MITSYVRLAAISFAWLAAAAAFAQSQADLPDLPPPISDEFNEEGPVADQPAGGASGPCCRCRGGECCCEPRCRLAESEPCCGQRRGCCGRFWECWCRCWCGSFSYAAYGSPRMAANCCDGCRPQIFMDDMFCRCNTCNN